MVVPNTRRKNGLVGPLQPLNQTLYTSHVDGDKKGNLAQVCGDHKTCAPLRDDKNTTRGGGKPIFKSLEKNLSSAQRRNLGALLRTLGAPCCHKGGKKIAGSKKNKRNHVGGERLRIRPEGCHEGATGGRWKRGTQWRIWGLRSLRGQHREVTEDEDST